MTQFKVNIMNGLDHMDDNSYHFATLRGAVECPAYKMDRDLYILSEKTPEGYVGAIHLDELNENEINNNKIGLAY